MWYLQVNKNGRKKGFIELFILLSIPFLISNHSSILCCTSLHIDVPLGSSSSIIINHHDDPGADDDWYWIMPTVVENRSSTAYVVTNDLMRDHRLAFLEPRPFIRWRTTQVMHFDFSKAGKHYFLDLSYIYTIFLRFCIHVSFLCMCNNPL